MFDSCFPSKSRECQNRDDLARLVAEQFRLYDLNGVPFAEETGCLQPCHYQVLKLHLITCYRIRI